MSDELTIQGGVDQALLTGLVDLARRVDAAKKSSDELAESVKQQPGAWARAEAGFQGFLGRAKDFWESSSRFGEAYKNIKEPLGDITEGLVSAAEGTARLASEQARLDRVQQDLGVSLREAQDYAGGFARETEIATAAITLQGQGLRVTQRELDALTRLGMRRAADTGKEFAEVMESVTETVLEGGDELGKLAPELLAVADGSHSAGQRLAAMVTAAERAGPATRDARTEMERYRAAIESSQRQMAAGFVDGLTRLSQLTSQTRDARDASDEWDRSMRAVGTTFATVASAALNGVGAIAGVVATAIATVPALLQGTGNAVREFTNVDNLRRGVAGERAGAAFRAALNNETITSLTDFVEARVSALEAIASDALDDRTTAAPEAPGGPTAAQRARDRRLRTTSNDALAGNSDSDTDDGADRGKKFGARDRLRASDTDLAERRRSVDALLAQERERQSAEDERTTAAKGARDARDAEAFGRSDAGRFQTRQQEIAEQREQRAQEQRLERMRSFTDRWRDLHTEQVDITAQAMDSLAGAIDAGGEAIGGAWEQIVTGQKDVADSLQDGLKSYLLTVAKRESIEGGTEIAKGLSALAGIVTAPLAPGHFAAAAAHFAVAAATGVAGAAIPASAGSAAGRGGGSSASSGPRERPLTSNAQNAATGGGNVYNFTFGGGIIMGTPRDVAQGVVGLLNDPSNGAVINARRVQG